MQWEYLVVDYETIDVRFLNDALKEQGKEGFELVQVVGKRYYFKRQKPS